MINTSVLNVMMIFTSTFKIKNVQTLVLMRFLIVSLVNSTVLILYVILVDLTLLYKMMVLVSVRLGI